MFSNCKPFQVFREELEKRGVTIRWGWSAKRHPDSKYDDVAFAIFVGNGFQPSVHCAVIVNYDEEGFGLFIDSDSRWAPGSFDSVVGDADRIAGT